MITDCNLPPSFLWLSLFFPNCYLLLSTPISYKFVLSSPPSSLLFFPFFFLLSSTFLFVFLPTSFGSIFSPDVPHSQPRRWGVRDPSHLTWPRLCPHCVRCCVPFRGAVGLWPLWQRGGTRERCGWRGRPLIRLHFRQRPLTGTGAPESGSYEPVRRKHFVGFITGNGEKDVT